jgi:hypothetical protein
VNTAYLSKCQALSLQSLQADCDSFDDMMGTEEIECESQNHEFMCNSVNEVKTKSMYNKQLAAV